MRPIIVGNFKMNGDLGGIAAYARVVRGGAQGVRLVVCPPFPLLAAYVAALGGSGVEVGAQDCHALQAGAHTGDVSAVLLKEVGCEYVILGHSERRAGHGETNADVAAKASAAGGAGLVAIVCVGETGMERDAGEAEDVVRTQLRHSLPAGFGGIVAYEPVWAIGSGRTPSAGDVTAMHGAVRAALVAQLGEGGSRVPILYGGSVKPDNAGLLLGLPDVGGALVGGASLQAADFLAIAAAAPSV